jgi:hypothetical protein
VVEIVDFRKIVNVDKVIIIIYIEEVVKILWIYLIVCKLYRQIWCNN